MLHRLITVICLSVTANLAAQNYELTTFIGDDDSYWSGATEYFFLYPNNNLSEWYDLPFSWSFYGEPVTGYKIAHDGYIIFDNVTGPSVGVNTALPNPSGPNHAIYALWDEFTNGAVISTKTYGEAPRRVHTITWAAMGDGWDGPTVSIKIYENCGDFEVVLSDGTTGSCTIGCENSDGTVGVEVVGSPFYQPVNPGYNAASYEVHRFHWEEAILHDASLVGIRIDNHLSVGNHVLTGAVRNEGASTLDSYYVNYSLNDGEVQSTLVQEVDTVWTGDAEVVITGVDWSYEISWDIEDENGNVIASGADYADGNTYGIPLCIPETGDYTFNWYDSYGDGWNGCTYVVLDADGNVLLSGSPANGSGGSSDFSAEMTECDWYIDSFVTNSKLSLWTHDMPIAIASTSDQYELKVWVSDVNGSDDQMSCNDTLVEYLTGFNNTSGDKRVIVEKWTGTWCAYCIDGVVVLDNLVEQYGSDVIPVAVHDGDPMEIDDELRYAFSATAYPSALIDRHDFDDSYNYYSEELGRGSWLWATTERMDTFTPVNVEIDHDYNPDTRLLEATVSLDYTDNSAGDARLVLMVMEDHLSGEGPDWAQANAYNDTPGHPYYGAGNSVDGFEHRHVLREYIESNSFGVDDIVPHHVEAGDSYSHSFTYEVPEEFNDSEVSIAIALVKFMDGNDNHYVGVRGQRYVYNANEVDLIASDISQNSGASPLIAYPNPTSGLMHLSRATDYAVYSLVGDLLIQDHGSMVDLSSFSTGIYLLKTNIEGVDNGPSSVMRIVKH